MEVLIINGPNLNLVGKRNPSTYGNVSLGEYFKTLEKKLPQINFSFFQSNLEGELIDQIQESDAKGIILNAGGFTHTSVAIRDAIEAVETPVVEVHISNIAAREPFRHDSLLSPVCEGCIFGFGLKGYELAVNYFINLD